MDGVQLGLKKMLAATVMEAAVLTEHRRPAGLGCIYHAASERVGEEAGRVLGPEAVQGRDG